MFTKLTAGSRKLQVNVLFVHEKLVNKWLLAEPQPSELEWKRKK